ncbi:VCBS repeat-containing protein [candidate division KSB1 bacterium]|nr:VCBS repeat-containing protein [candidate division KSB1 bacterium]
MFKNLKLIIVLVLLSILTFNAQVRAQQLFGPARLDLVFDATAFTVSDINRDGLADFITVSDAGKITLFLGQVFGGYTSEEIYDGPWSLSMKNAWFFITDCNNDGSVDLIFVESDGFTLNVFFGDGTGQFNAPVTSKITDFNISEDGFPGAYGDINGDGYADLVYQELLAHGDFPDNYYYDYILLGQGDGRFIVSDTLSTHAISFKFETCVIQDFNGDGNGDIAAVKSHSRIDSLYVYTSDGQGKFSLNSIWEMGLEVQNLMAGDFNNDGYMDVISGNRHFESGYLESINVRLGDGNGGFSVMRSYPLGEKLWKIGVADFNSDLDLDVAFLSTDKGLGVGYGNGDGTFSRTVYLNPSLWWSLIVIDINGDTFQDIMFLTYGGLSQLFNDGIGGFEIAPQFPDGLPDCENEKPFAVALDADKNGITDLLVTNPCSESFSLLYGQSDGFFGSSVEKIDLPGRITVGTALDLNADGQTDVVGADKENGRILTMLAQASGGFSEIRQHAVAANPRIFAVGDFNEDNNIDIAYLTEDRLKIIILFGQGDGAFSGSSEISFADSVAAFCAADFDKDARPDLIVYDYFSPEFTPLHFYKGNGDGSFTAKKSFAGLIGGNAIKTADVNNDGNLDLILIGLVGSVVHLGDGDGNFIVSEQPELAILGRTVSALVLDVNLDGNVDLVVSDFNPFTQQIKVFLGKGDGKFLSSDINYGVSNIAGTLCAADFNNDGSTELAVVHPDTGLVSILSMSVRLEHDITVKTILAPTGTITAGLAVTPQASVFNRGPSAESLQMECKIGDIYRNTVDCRLDPGEQKTIDFPPWIPANAGVYAVTVTAILASDQIPSNNQVTGSVIVTQQGDTGTLLINDVTPNRGGDNGWLSVKISGSGFDKDTKIKLVRNGREIPAFGYFNEQTLLIDSTAIKAVFYLQGAESGGWDVVAENTDGRSFTFKNGLTVEPAEKTLWVDIIGPTRFGLSAHANTWLSYNAMIGNSGNINLDNAVMILDVPRWLELRSIVKTATNDTILLGNGEWIYDIINGEKRDSLRVADIDSTKIPLWCGILNPNEVVTFRLNVRGDWVKYRDLVVRPRLRKGRSIDDDDGGGIGIGGILMDGAKCFGKNLAESFADKGDLTMQDFENAGEKALDNMGENLFWTGVTLAVEIIFPWTIPIIEGYNIASGLIGSIKSAEQMFKLAFKFLLLFAEWWGDPNFKEGPAGYGVEGFITDNRPYFYQVHFENDSAATASPPFVIVRDTLDSDLNWSTFKNIDSSHPITRTTLDSTTGEIVWLFDGINLPPNKIPPEGEAWLSYSIWPKSGLNSGTQITNRAAIVFAGQDTIITNTVVNTIDNEPPSVQVESLVSVQHHVAFAVTWSGSDSESGIYLYNVYVSTNGEEYKLWQQTEKTSAVFIGKNGAGYSFYCTASDHVGHISAIPAAADAVTRIDASEDIGVNPNPFVPSRGFDKITFFGDAVAFAEIKVYNKAGRLVTTLRETMGESTLDWDATNEKGENLASGVYIWILAGRNDSKSKGKFAIIR